jgi:hypothetical protein
MCVLLTELSRKRTSKMLQSYTIITVVIQYVCRLVLAVHNEVPMCLISQVFCAIMKQALSITGVLIQITLTYFSTIWPRIDPVG